ncbi:MAG: HD domain-containing protein [Nanoarchaeota archaeon]|nr:HD domain-containing protein [Nanoarchaeota archaeon]
MEQKLQNELEPLMNRIKEYNPRADLDKVKKAFSHTDEYSWGIAKMLMGFKADTVTLISALLYNPFMQKKLSEQAIEKEFGKDILDILNGVARINLIKSKPEESENVRKIIFAMAKDVRIILIKLSERVQKMRELKNSKNIPENKVIAEDILNIYAPIAYKLGVYSIKSELEDSALYFIDPKAYSELKSKVAFKKDLREKQIAKAVDKIKHLLREKNINARVLGRAKHFYSIYRKMELQNKRFEEILDLLAIRIITETVDDCYRVLGIIHSNYNPIISEFYDYIANPKPNMYQSIHTKVIFENKPIEVQIRTLGMHQMAEEGIAAHWRYKNTERDKLFDKKIAWMKQILEWKTTSTAKELIDSLKIDLFKNEIIVLTPQGDPISLPEQSTPIDFAYHVHTDVGNSTEKAKVNGAIVPLEHQLKAGDVVEIMTSKNARPSRNWLKFAKATFARSKIREALHIQGVQTEEEPTPKLAHKISIEPKTKEQQRIILKEIPHISRDCNPEFGEKIIAVITKDGKISIHKESCKNLMNIEQNKKLKAGWKEIKENKTILTISVEDRMGVLAEVLNTIALQKINVNTINSVVKKDKADIIVDVAFENKEQLENVIAKLKQIKNVINIRKK